MALASPRTSAHIIPLPGAAVAPVVNPKRRGSYPKGVVPLARCKVLMRRRLAREQEQRERDINFEIGYRAGMGLPPLVPAGYWPFATVTQADYNLINHLDRESVETFITGIVSVRKRQQQDRNKGGSHV